MDQLQLEQLKDTLRGIVKSIEQPLGRLEEIAVQNAPDTIDRVQLAAERDLAMRQLECDFSRLQSVRLALERLEDGTYGTCLSCEDEISLKRLQALPWASYCLKCQDIADRERKQPASEDFGPFSRMKDVA
jgi:DnaK suppressor protein